MKKIILCLIVTLILLIPIKVNADMSAPGFTEYEVVATKDKTNLYKNKVPDYWGVKNPTVALTIDKGSKLIVDYEFNYNNETYGSVTYNGEIYNIKLTDFMLANAIFNDFSNLERVNEKTTYFIFDDVYLYNGPSKIYSKVNDTPLPKGEITLDVEYADNMDRPSWYYVSYNGTKGWLFISQENDYFYPGTSGVASVLPSDYEYYSPAITIKNITSLRNEPHENASKIDINIPVYTKLDYKYFYSSPSDSFNYVYIEYNGTKGWLKISYSESKFRDEFENPDALFYIPSKLLITNKNDINSYSTFYDNNSLTSTKYSYNKEIDYDFSYYYDGYAWFGIKDNDSYKWLKSSYKGYASYNAALTDIALDYNTSVITVNEISLYEDFSDSKTLTKIPFNTELKIKYYYNKVKNPNSEDYEIEYDTWYYVEFNNQKGWIKDEKLGRSYPYRCETTDSVKIYTRPTESSEVINTINSNEKIEAKYDIHLNNYSERWTYITYNNESGWVRWNNNLKELERIEIQKPEKPAPEPEPGNNEPQQELPLPTINNKKENSLINKLSPNMIIALCVFCALCLAITALTTIILINKRKEIKSNNLEK